MPVVSKTRRRRRKKTFQQLSRRKLRNAAKRRCRKSIRVGNANAAASYRPMILVPSKSQLGRSPIFSKTTILRGFFPPRSSRRFDVGFRTTAMKRPTRSPPNFRARRAATAAAQTRWKTRVCVMASLEMLRVLVEATGYYRPAARTVSVNREKEKILCQPGLMRLDHGFCREEKAAIRRCSPL